MDKSDQPSMSDISRIHVGVRVRPLNERELSGGSTCVWKYSHENNTIQHSTIPNTSTCVDYLYNESCDNTHIYNTIAAPLVESTLNGINGTLFAYGQTSSGKTYTMSGITRLAIDDIFSRNNIADRVYTYTVSYIEIYNEKIKDLLNGKNNNLSVHEDLYKGIFIGGLTEMNAANSNDVLQLLQRGDENRHIGSTAMNEHSSRSHSIFRLHISSKPINTTQSSSTSKTGVLSATLQLIDLAGSERQQHTQSSGQRLKEGGAINKSLLTLTTVIRKLSECKNNQNAHVNYRDSKLTRILQPSLGGNSRTAIMCCITVSSQHIDETMSTLRFAARAKNVTNKIKINEIIDEQTLIKQLKKEVASLRKQLHCSDSLSSTDPTDAIGVKRQRLTISDHTNRRDSSIGGISISEIYDAETQMLQDRCTLYECTVNELNDRIKELESAVDIVQLIEQRKLVEMERDDLKEQLYELQQTIHSMVESNNNNHNQQALQVNNEIIELQHRLAESIQSNQRTQADFQSINIKYKQLHETHLHDIAAAEIELQLVREQHRQQLDECELDKRHCIDAAIESSQREVKQIEEMINSIEQLMNDRLNSATAEKQALRSQINILTQQVDGYSTLQSQYDELIIQSSQYTQQLDMVQNQHTHAMQTINTLNQQLQSVSDENQQLSTQLQCHTQLQHKLEQLELQYNSSRAELNNANQQLTELQTTNAHLCNQLDEIEDNAIEFNTSRTSISSTAPTVSNDMMCEIVDRVEQEKVELQQHYHALQSQTNSLQVQLTEKQQTIEAILIEKYDIQCQLEHINTISSKYQHTVQEQIKQYTDTIDVLQQQCIELTANTECQTATSQSSIDILQQQLHTVQDTLQLTQQQLAESNNINIAASNEAVQRLNHTQQQLVDANNTVEQLKQRCSELQQQLHDTADTHTVTATQYTEQLGLAHQQIQQLQQQYDAAISNNVEIKQQIDELTNCVNDKNEQIDAAGVLLDDANNDITSLNDKILLLEQSVTQHLQALTSMQQQATATRDEHMSTANQSIQLLTDQLLSANNELQLLQAAINDTQHKSVEYTMNIDTLQQANVILSQQLQSSEQLSTQLQQQCAELQSTVSTLQDANQLLQSDITALTEKMTQLVAYTQSRSDEINQSNQIKSQNALLTQHNNELLQQVALMHDTISTLDDKVAAASKGVDMTQIDALTSQFNQLQQQYTELQHQHTILKDTANNTSTSTNSEMSELKSELDKYKRRSELYSNKYTEIRNSSKVQSDQLQQYKIQINVLEQTLADRIRSYDERITSLKSTIDERDLSIRELEKSRPSEKMLMQLVKATRDVQKGNITSAVVNPIASTDNINKPAVNPILPVLSIKPLQSISVNAPITLNKPIAINTNKPILNNGLILNKPALTILDKENHKI